MQYVTGDYGTARLSSTDDWPRVNPATARKYRAYSRASCGVVVSYDRVSYKHCNCPCKLMTSSCRLRAEAA